MWQNGYIPSLPLFYTKQYTIYKNVRETPDFSSIKVLQQQKVD